MVGLVIGWAGLIASVRPSLAWKVLVGASVLLIGWMSFLGIICASAGYNGEHVLLGSNVLWPLLAATAAWWWHSRHRSRTGRTRAERLVLGTLVVLATSCVVGNLPFHLAFAISRPALDRVADEVAAGTRTLRSPPVWAGLFEIRSAYLNPDKQQGVVLVVDHHFGFARGYHFCRPSIPFDQTDSNAMAYRPVDVRLGGGWHYR